MPAPLSYRIREFFGRLGERIAGVGHALTSPFERLFHWLGHGLIHGSEGFERAEGGLFALGRIITWPVRIIGRLVMGIGRLLAPEWLRDAWHRLVRGLIRGVGKTVDVLNLDGLIRWVVWLSQPLWRPVAAVVGFFYAWFATRPYRQMLWGLPALILLLPVLAAVGWRLFRGPESIAKAYQAAVKVALEAEDLEAMALWERKLDQLEVDTQRSEYLTALKLTQDDDESKRRSGRERMERLAPLDEPGYPAAHFWLLQSYLSLQSDLPKEQRLNLAEKHLSQLASLGIRGPQVQLARAIWLAESERPEEAVELLEPLATRLPDAAVQLMLLDAQLGRRDAARRDATRVRDLVGDAQRRGANLSAQDYQTLAAAYQLLGDMAGMEQALRDWLVAEPDRQVARNALGELSLMQLQRVIAQRRVDVPRLAQLLADAARCGAPPQAIDAALAAVTRRSDGVQVRAALVDAALTLENVPANMQLALGTSAATAGDFQAAEQLLRRATAAAPEEGSAWNNLAWVLAAEGDDAQLAEARDAAARAVELSPESASFRETRGQVLVKLEQWEAAIADLEYALNGLPDSKPTHAALAKAYAAVGQTDLAAAHAALAE